jgi:recombination protein RecA
MAKEEKKSTKLDHTQFKSKGDALKAAMSKIEKDYGAEAIQLFGERVQRDVPATPTGSMGLDIALGVGGYPRGRIIEIYGPEASGKTTLTLHAIAECQKRGGTCAFIDVEHALDPKYATNLGVDMDGLLLSQPGCGEEALDIAETLISSGGVDMVVIDSVAALVPQAELDGDMGSHQMGLQARLMSQACRKLTALAGKTKTTVFFINQIRMKIGVMFGNPETTSGGQALKYYASQRLDIRRVGAIKQGEDQVGGRTRVKVIKNKVAPPFKEVEFDIRFGKGIHYLGELVDLGSELGLVEKAGAWYSFQGERIGQGRDNACEYLAEHPEAAKSIDEAIRKHYGLDQQTAATE